MIKELLTIKNKIMTLEGKTIASKDIIRNGKTIGYISLLRYTSKTILHLEYSIGKEFRNQGIMSNELPKYLEWCKENQHTQLLAMVEKGNEASINLLTKNGFIQFSKATTTFAYLIDMSFSRERFAEFFNNFNNIN